MSVFRFKSFSVTNQKSAMKVNTDGVLLGASMTIFPDDSKFLDVGTGTGTIALMAAQRCFAMKKDNGNCVSVDAIDIDEVSAEEAGLNFQNSPWSACLHARHISLQDLSISSDKIYDMIFSNPPYFEDSLQAPLERRNNARHTTNSLSYRELLEFAKNHLSSSGHISFILPSEQESDVCRHAGSFGLHLFRIVRIKTVARKSPRRIILEFARKRKGAVLDETICIQNEGQYTEEYLSLMKDFYLFA